MLVIHWTNDPIRLGQLSKEYFKYVLSRTDKVGGKLYSLFPIHPTDNCRLRLFSLMSSQIS